MQRTKKQKTLQETLSSIDGVLAALDAYPNLEDALLATSQNLANRYLGKYYPTQIDFTKEVLEHIVGKDVLIEIVSKFLVNYLPEVELAIKGVLLANMQSLGDGCLIDPIIRKKNVKEGITFELSQIDLIDKLTVSPLDEKVGQYYYFGIDGCESAYDVLQSAISPDTTADSDGKSSATSYANRAVANSVGHYYGERKRDFDCLLWYMKNKTAYRQVWGKQTTTSEDIFNGSEDGAESWLKEKGDTNSGYYEIDESGSVTLWTFSDGWTSEQGNAAVQMDENQKYRFKEGKTVYVYEYGNAATKTLSQKKCYYSATYGVFYYNGAKWVKTSLNDSKDYNAMEDLPTTIKDGEYYMVDGSVYKITSDPKISKYKNGTEYVSNVKSEECIDITNGLDNNIYRFIDNDGKVLPVQNTGTNKWYKAKSGNETENTQNTVYYVKKSSSDVTFDINVDEILISPHDEDGKPYICLNSKTDQENKYTKDFGILTLEYSARSGGVVQSDGNPMKKQTPYDNVIHVFFGNVKEIGTSEINELQANLEEQCENNKTGAGICDKIEEMRKSHNTVWKKKKKEWKKNGESNLLEETRFKVVNDQYDFLLYGDGSKLKERITANDSLYNDEDGLADKLEDIESIINSYYDDVDGGSIYPNEEDFDYDAFLKFSKELTGKLDGYSIKAYANRMSNVVTELESMLYLSARNFVYPDAVKNYYYKRTLYEFNIDYITSLQLFDSKVLAAQLISSLFGGVSISAMAGATLSWKTKLIQDTVKDMVEKIIAAEDVTVSDCFYTFSNDTYNGMLRATELRQAGLYSNYGEENGNNAIDPISLLSSLNEIDSSTDLDGQVSIIKGAILDVSAEISKDTYNTSSGLSANSHFGLQISFIETLIKELCTQLVMAVLSPKVYLLILVNLEMFGLDTNFNIKSFLEKFSNLIRSIVQSVVDQFIQYLVNEIMSLIEDLVDKLMTKIAFEQAEMYMRLLKQILKHLKLLFSSKKTSLTWTQDEVTSADIEESEDDEEVIEEC